MDTPRPSRHVVCRLEDIPDPGARGFSFPGAAIPDEWFLVRHGAAVHAYRNLCPHAGRFLNWKEDAFLTKDRTLIMCAGHGALFDPTDGHCVAGAALGQTLERLPAAVEDGEVVVYGPEPA
ncbi:MAG TPA: Rieske 2Fe-2S domain-containing protein [Gammaproteobacteria bacterium]|jgi:nitrite reductase/ring-hydroxylating ferredoxin subunit|nr:Rieske 2Fe-2S domain-containing protein [Gammaproteobacteria bacterium]